MDEVPDPHALDIKLWENDQLRQDYNTSDIEHPIPEIITWAAKIATLEAGDVFACGTHQASVRCRMARCAAPRSSASAA